MTDTAEAIKEEYTQIVEFNPFETQLAEFKDRYDNIVYDLDDPEQDKQARSDRLSIGKVLSKLDKAHKELKAPLKAKTDLIDAERKRIKDDLLGVQNKIKSQIAEHERKAQEHAEMLQQKVENIEAFGLFAEGVQPDSERLDARLHNVKQIDINDSYEHRKADAALAQVDTIKKLESMLEDALKREAEEAELERLRKEQAAREQAEREQRIADEARIAAEQKAEAEKRKLEQEKIDAQAAAERAEREKKEAAEKAEADKAAAIQRERDLAEQREKLRIAAEEEAERERAAELERRENDKKHRAAINNAALQCLVDGGLSQAAAKKAITLIAEKKVTNVSISY